MEAIQDKFPLYCLGFGFDVNFNFLEKLSLLNNGVARRIYADADADLQLKVNLGNIIPHNIFSYLAKTQILQSVFFLLRLRLFWVMCVVFTLTGSTFFGEAESFFLERVKVLFLFVLGVESLASNILGQRGTSYCKSHCYGKVHFGLIDHMMMIVRESLFQQGFYDEVANPLLTDVVMIYNGGTNLTRTNFSQYYNGSEIVVAGQIADNNIETFVPSVVAISVSVLHCTTAVVLRKLLAP